jgi:serine protease Do
MRKNMFLIAFLVVPALILSACSALPSIQISIGQPAKVVTSTSQASVQAVVQKDAPAIQEAVNTASVNADAATLQSELQAVYQKVNPSVVSITVVEQLAANQGNRRFPFQDMPSTTGMGSGFVWDTQGYIVTNNHVVADATSIMVTFADGTTADATLVGTDPNADLAVIKVNVDASLLFPVEVGDSTQVQVGQLAIAIGNPYGLANTMTQGIISALSRSLPADLSSQNTTSSTTYTIPDIIQTDAAINPGNSGGVLVDITGKLIGVTFAIESNSNANAGIGFVIPAEIVNKVVPSIVANGKFDHPYLGIYGGNLNPSIAKAMGLDENQKGVLLNSVTSNGPAEKAGLRGSTQTVTIDGQDVEVGGDVIIAINGISINQIDELVSYIFLKTNAGEKATLTVLRDGKQIDLTVTIGAIPAD